MYMPWRVSDKFLLPVLEEFLLTEGKQTGLKGELGEEQIIGLYESSWT